MLLMSMIEILFDPYFWKNFKQLMNKREINFLRDKYEQLQKAKGEMVKKVNKMENYSSYMCLSFHGVRDDGEYMAHKVVEIIKSVKVPIEPYDIAASHYLTGTVGTKLFIAKFILQP